MRTILVRAAFRAATLACATLVASVALPAVAETPLPFDAKTWKLTGDAKIETYLGRPALRVRSGGAVAEGVSLQDGTIDLDVAIGTHRNFAAFYVRRERPGEYEEFYLRTHKSELPDAIQYVPAWQGVGGWQLFHGPGFTAKATFPRDRWFPVRIVLSGDRAAVFVNGAPQPQLVVSRLRREPRAGSFEIESVMIESGDPGARASFSNVVVRPGEVPFDFSKAPPLPEPEPPGVVRRWQVSERFTPAAGPIRSLPAAAASGAWQTVPAEPSGLVVAERYVKRMPEDERGAVLTRIAVDSDSDAVREFRFGYSDEVTVFLNGRPLFSGDAHYSHDNPRQEGLIGYWQGTVYLPLRKGRNELVLAVSEVFGGWGWMGAFPDAKGLRVTPWSYVAPLTPTLSPAGGEGVLQ
jgi:hypothetical protein